MVPPAPLMLSVLVDLPQHSGLGAPLSYLHDRSLAPGTLVMAPLGRREVLGIVWDPPGPHQPLGRDGGAGATLRPLSAVFHGLPPLNENWRRLVAFAADYYQRGLGEMALSALPPELRKSSAASLARRCQRLHKAGADAAGRTRQDPVPPLTSEQALALSALRSEMAQAQRAALLHGVTGSGKTEVYLQMAQEVLAQGRQVLIMVPEINLTPQLEARLQERFSGHHLACLHSGLTPAQRINHWLQAHLATADLLLGTRMSVMASLPRLGLIIVDEEHDASYKQQEGARYSARDLAVYRARLEGIPVVLGSATPSLESWHKAKLGRYRWVSMPSRVGAGPLPAVDVVDMSRQPRGGAAGESLSTALIAAVQERIDRGQQSLLLLNRRGYAPVIHCGACQWKSACAHCSAWQVFHKTDRSLRCHHCGAAQRVPRACPSCGNLDLTALGRGTERLEEQLAPLLRAGPSGPPRILRIDADTTRKAGSLRAQLAQVHEGQVDVLIGTQMVAKGHDFRRMTLVAAVNPDAALFSSDFRAPERLFALLMQAAGRAGRDPGQAAHSRMLIQTAHPSHPLVQALRRHDYESFAQAQMLERQTVGLPPFSHLAMLRVEARTVAAAQAFLDDAAGLARQALIDQIGDGQTLTVYPAVPAPMARVADLERWQMLLESASRPQLQALLRRWSPEITELRQTHRGVVRWALDVDPMAI